MAGAGPFGGAAFIDHYAVLGASPGAPQEELRRLYFEKVREFHPDKRPGSAGRTGERVTQALNQAWEVLRDPAAHEAYDAVWKAKDHASPHRRAEAFRVRGNELHMEGRELARCGSS